MKVVCIGLGNMGAPLASRIAARHSTAVWDLTDGLSTKFASQREGCVPIVTTEQLGAEVADCDAVLTCVPNTAATHKIWEMLKPSLGANSGGTFWIDATSGRADEAAVLAQALWGERTQPSVARRFGPIHPGVGVQGHPPPSVLERARQAVWIFTVGCAARRAQDPLPRLRRLRRTARRGGRDSGGAGRRGRGDLCPCAGGHRLLL
jgi:prephenate dehydrogenase